MKKLLLFFACAALALVACDKSGQPTFTPSPKYISNGIVKLGVDMSAGGSIFYFSEVAKERNLLNHNDKGRFIQQSYYGIEDGSMWADVPWNWNPIQGGGYRGKAATVLEQNIQSDQLYIKSLPVHWATGEDVTDAYMEETITLDGNVARLHLSFTYNGTVEHPSRHQELPAIFADADLKHMYYYEGDAPWTNADLTSRIPGWPNEYLERHEEWAAYVDDTGWGIGVYTPGTVSCTAYRSALEGAAAGPAGPQCSYFAPIREFRVMPGMTFSYDVYVTIGTLEQIRERFYAIHAAL